MTAVTGRSRVETLAQRMGIVSAFRMTSGELRVTPDETRRALLAAMGFDASSEATAAAALRELDDREASELLDPVCVAVEGSAPRVALRRPARAGARATWRVELSNERGEVHYSEGRLSRRAAALHLPPELACGYYDLRVSFEDGAGSREAQQRLVIAPRRCVEVGERIGLERVFGLMANLYTLRGRSDWGVGDLGDLARLVALAGDAGAAFVGINPLHHLSNRGADVSPYAPVSRLYRNPIYLDVEAIPELAECELARARLADPGVKTRLAALREARLVDYEGVAQLEREILVLLHQTFAAKHRDQATPRGRAYARYCEREGELLTDFATWLALDAHFADGAGRDWRRWPSDYHHPRSAGVPSFREQHAEEVDFHRYVQFELDRQLERCARAGEAAGLRIGLLGDLALGSSGAGADAWLCQELFARDVRMGAPPDDFNPQGQDWSMPALDPRRLRGDGYRFWSDVLRTSLRHMGALRIDHAMAVSRLYWIPPGRPPTEGAYVNYPSRDLLGILALESRRHRALVIGEDLGTVPPGFAALLARWGILSWRVLYFERSVRGFRASRRYSRRALVTANTHDLPLLAGFIRGRDLELQRGVGAIGSDRELAAAQAERAASCRKLAERLAAEGILDAGEPLPPPPRLSAVVHRFLSRTPAPLVGLALDDLAGESEPVNLPGIGPDRFPSWRRRMACSLEEIPSLLSGLAGDARASAHRDPAARQRG